jgi:protein O-GlcNAc transferase
VQVPLARVLAVEPSLGDTINNLGVLSWQSNRPEEAQRLFLRALSCNQLHLHALSNLAALLAESGHTRSATRTYRRLLAAVPTHATALRHLATASGHAGDPGTSLVLCRSAVHLLSDPSELADLGNALWSHSLLTAAAGAYRRAVALDPASVAAAAGVGRSRTASGQNDRAAVHHRRCVTLRPDLGATHYNLGTAYSALARWSDARSTYRRAAAIDPAFPAVWTNLSNVERCLGRLTAAVSIAARTLVLQPNAADAWNNIGCALRDLGRHQEAMAAFEQALRHRADFADAHRNKLAIQLYLTDDPDLLYGASLEFAARHRRHDVTSQSLGSTPDRRRAIRIGLVSADFNSHSVARSIRNLVEHRDRASVELACYSVGGRDDPTTQWFAGMADLWRVLRAQSDEEAAAAIRRDGVDVAVFLAGRFDENRPLIASFRAAPVQVWMHDGGTSGLTEVDAWLTDAVLHPPGTTERFVEELVHLPVFYNFPAPDESPIPRRSARHGEIVFGSFNNPAKISSWTIESWISILQRVSGAALLLKFQNWFDDGGLRERITSLFRNGGVDPERVHMIARAEHLDAHMRRYADVDIALDTFPFNGATTTFEALSAGVPVITCAGRTFASRTATSMLAHVDLLDLSASTMSEYVACAVRLAYNQPRLDQLRRELPMRLRRSLLCDGRAYARSVVEALRDLWHRRITESRTR